mmetsp:Transcript_10908/g.16471  ORF Transcript_10908/g.16471 Transcript_10908/m.16471 type:complete len:244 (+) Transcript_10908:533-1264(+)
MPRFGGTHRITTYVGNHLGKRFHRRIKTKRHFNIFVLQIAINGFGNAHHRALALVLGKELRQYGCIGVAIVAANHHQTVEIVVRHRLQRRRHLFLCRNLVAPALNHIEATSVAISIQKVGSQLHKAIDHHAFRTASKTQQHTVLVQLLERVKQTTNHVVTARCATTRQHHTNTQRRCAHFLIGFGERDISVLVLRFTLRAAIVFHVFVANVDHWLTIREREQTLNLFCFGHRGRLGTNADLNA